MSSLERLLALIQQFPDPPSGQPRVSVGSSSPSAAEANGTSSAYAAGAKSSGEGKSPAAGPSTPVDNKLTRSASEQAITNSPAAERARTETIKMEPFSVDLVLKGCRGQLLPKEQQNLNRMLLEMPRPEAIKALEEAYQRLQAVPGKETKPNSKPAEEKKAKGWIAKKMAGIKSNVRGKIDSVTGSGDPPVVKLSKHSLTFGLTGNQLAPLNKELVDEVTITHISGGKAKFQFLQTPLVKSHVWNITPSSGVMKRKQSVTIKLGLVVRTTLKLSEVITLEIEDCGRFFLLVTLDSEKSVFGVDVAELDMIDEGAGMQIPSVLITLKNYLYENGGLNQVGIFRVAGDDNETMEIKDQLNRGTFCGCKDINCIASLIKIWFRELPEQILNALPPQAFLETENEADCLEAFENLKQPNKNLMIWLLDLLADVAALESVNKMGPKNLAIVTAPNLFRAETTDPLESLLISQKVVNFVHQLLCHRLRQSYDIEVEEE